MTDLRQATGSGGGSLRVLLAHDDRLQLFGIARALADDGIEVVGEAHTSEQVAPLLARSRPDVLLVAIDLVDGGATTLLPLVGERYPKTRTIVLGGIAEAARASGLCEAGAAGFVSTAVEPRHLPALLREAFAGTFYVRLPEREALLPVVQPLTERELSVLRGAARGLSNEGIGRELWLSSHTVKSHLHRIYSKLDVANRTEAVRWALENRLLEPERAVA